MVLISGGTVGDGGASDGSGQLRRRPRRPIGVDVDGYGTAQHGVTGELLVNQRGDPVHPRVLERAWSKARDGVIAQQGKSRTPVADRLPTRARLHDTRHTYASVLIDSGASVKVVQARLRHASATTTLNTYSHMMSDSDEASRRAIDAVMDAYPTDDAMGQTSG
ncbi:MAG: tyrosine-type recombinase/integrase [Actinomycetes bacterium]